MVKCVLCWFLVWCVALMECTCLFCNKKSQERERKFDVREMARMNRNIKMAMQWPPVALLVYAEFQTLFSCSDQTVMPNIYRPTRSQQLAVYAIYTLQWSLASIIYKAITLNIMLKRRFWHYCNANTPELMLNDAHSNLCVFCAQPSPSIDISDK